MKQKDVTATVAFLFQVDGYLPANLQSQRNLINMEFIYSQMATAACKGFNELPSLLIILKPQ